MPYKTFFHTDSIILYSVCQNGYQLNNLWYLSHNSTYPSDNKTATTHTTETQTYARKLISNDHDAQVQTTNSLYSATSESARSSRELLLFCGILNKALGNSRIQSVV